MLVGEGFEGWGDGFAGAAPGCVDCGWVLVGEGGGLEGTREGLQSIMTTAFFARMPESCDREVRVSIFAIVMDWIR